jgi:hypothetical protein
VRLRSSRIFCTIFFQMALKSPLRAAGTHFLSRMSHIVAGRIRYKDVRALSSNDIFLDRYPVDLSCRWSYARICHLFPVVIGAACVTSAAGIHTETSRLCVILLSMHKSASVVICFINNETANFLIASVA